MEESIYNIIPPEVYVPPKQPRYVSKYNPQIAPTSSTFSPKNSSKLLVNNCGGTMALDFFKYDHKSKANTNKNNQIYRNISLNNQKCFLRKHGSTTYIGRSGKTLLSNIETFNNINILKKPQVPKANQKPLLKAKSSKNFILSNVIQAIFSEPKKQKENINYLIKKDYGKVPSYLEQMKNNSYAESCSKNNRQQQQNEKIRILSNEEIQQLISGLKQCWNKLNLQYQSITHMKITNDQLRFKSKKTRLQSQMQQIQKDIKKLNKQIVLIRA